MKRIGKKVAILLAVMALTGGYVHTASMTVQVTAASPEELQKKCLGKSIGKQCSSADRRRKSITQSSL